MKYTLTLDKLDIDKIEVCLSYAVDQTLSRSAQQYAREALTALLKALEDAKKVKPPIPYGAC